MNISLIVERILNIKYFAVPSNEDLPEAVLKGVIEMPTSRLIPCKHIIHPAITKDKLEYIELSLELPVELQNFLEFSDGAELFKIHYEYSEGDSEWIARFKILNHEELLENNLEQLRVFQSYAEFDGKIDKGSLKLNYLTFCEVGDGNYLSISLENNEIFFLDHEYGFYPYGLGGTEEAYKIIANTLGEWFELLIRTDGWGGLGNNFIPL